MSGRMGRARGLKGGQPVARGGAGNGDARADFAIMVRGTHAFDAGDFVL